MRATPVQKWYAPMRVASRFPGMIQRQLDESSNVPSDRADASSGHGRISNSSILGRGFDTTMTEPDCNPNQACAKFFVASSVPHTRLHASYVWHHIGQAWESVFFMESPHRETQIRSPSHFADESTIRSSIAPTLSSGVT